MVDAADSGGPAGHLRMIVMPVALAIPRFEGPEAWRRSSPFGLLRDRAGAKGIGHCVILDGDRIMERSAESADHHSEKEGSLQRMVRPWVVGYGNQVIPSGVTFFFTSLLL